MAPYIAFLHHLAAFTLFAMLVVELLLTKGELTLTSARILQRADRAYGIAAASIIVLGVLRVLYFEKGADYYMSSMPFMLKMAAFVLVGILSIVPTIEFLSWSAPLKAGRVPLVSRQKLGRIRMLVHIQLAGVAVVILAAALMAKGV
jgi:putative membrane protein